MIMKLSFVAYDFEYVIEKEKVLVLLYGRSEKYGKVCVRVAYAPYFYATVPHGQNVQDVFERKLLNLSVSSGSQGVAARVLQFEIVKKELLGHVGDYYKIYTNYPKAVPLIAKEIEKQGVACYEKDILFVHRYLRDMRLVPGVLWEAEIESKKLDKSKGEEDSRLVVLSSKVHHFVATQVLMVSGKDVHLVPLRILAIDIETYAHKKEIDSRINPILMVALYGFDAAGVVFEKVITWKKFHHTLKYVETVAGEKELLERFNELMCSYDADIVTGYFTDGFDFPYFVERAHQCGVVFTFGADGKGFHERRGAGARDTEVSIKGMLHLDLLKFVKYIFGKNLKTDSYSLNAVSQELLGEKKHEVNLDELSILWDQGSDRLSTFCEYNLQDTKLTYRLYLKLRSDIEEFTKIVGLPSFDVIRMRFSRLVESYILHRAIGFNVLAPNKPDDEEIGERMDESIEGAFVFEPKPGLYKDVVVFDFRSLYPSIITSHNIGPESFKVEDGTAKIHVPGKEEYWFSSKPGFIPQVLADLIRYRSQVKADMKTARVAGREQDVAFLEARSYAYKILANSFYGYLGFYGARWYCLECAASTTAYARYYIQRTLEQARHDGFEVVYGDTDSCFFLLGLKKIGDALRFMDEVNASLPGMMELEFEGHYPRAIFVGTKGSERGAKKKYALLKENGTLKITGFEVVRRNWSVYAKDLQQKVLELVLKDKVDDAVVFVKKSIAELIGGRVALKELVISTQLTRELAAYSSIGPHVRVARLLVERGEKVHAGMVLRYIIVKGQGSVGDRASIVEDVKEGEYDADYYLHHQVLPAVLSIFNVLGHSEDMLLGKGEQTGLGKFFSK